MNIALSRQTFDVLLELFGGNKEKTEILASGFEHIIQEAIIESNQNLKIHVKDEIKDELVTKIEFQRENEILRTEFQRENEILRTEFKRENEILRTEFKRENEILRAQFKRENEILRTELKQEIELSSIKLKAEISILDQKILRLDQKFNFLIILVILAMTLFNPTLIGFIEKLLFR